MQLVVGPDQGEIGQLPGIPMNFSVLIHARIQGFHKRARWSVAEGEGDVMLLIIDTVTKTVF